jgi:hypothetical protein
MVFPGCKGSRNQGVLEFESIQQNKQAGVTINNSFQNLESLDFLILMTADFDIP